MRKVIKSEYFRATKQDAKKFIKKITGKKDTSQATELAKEWNLMIDFLEGK